jgi:hypothetical protein
MRPNFLGLTFSIIFNIIYMFFEGEILMGLELNFSPEAYKRYLKKENNVSNARLRADDETFFDALLSPEGDMTQTAEGRAIIAALQSLDSE